MNKRELKKSLWKEIELTGIVGLIIITAETAWIVLDPSETATKEGIMLGNALMVFGALFCLGVIGVAEKKIRKLKNLEKK